MRQREQPWVGDGRSFNTMDELRWISYHAGPVSSDFIPDGYRNNNGAEIGE